MSACAATGVTRMIDLVILGIVGVCAVVIVENLRRSSRW